MSHRALEYLLSQPLLVTPEARDAAEMLVSRESGPSPLAVNGKRPATMDGAQAGTTTHDGVAIIPITGPIFRRSDWFADMCGPTTTVATIARDLAAATSDPAIKGILLDIDSPGGEAAGIGELAGMIRAASATKPLTAYVDNQGCSAAYWLASAASEVVCSESAMLGSIGVVMGYTKREDRPGTKSYEWVSDQSPDKRPDPETEKGRATIQAMVNGLADVFIANVAAYRDTTPETVMSDFGKGGVLIGKNAVAAGMADRVGTFDSALEDMVAKTRSSRAFAVSPRPYSSNQGTTMFGFLVKSKADGSISVEPQTAENGAQPVATTIPVSTASTPDVGAELAAARQQLALARIETITVKADGFYNTLFAANKIVPAEKSDLVGAFVQASIDDLAHPLANGTTRVSLVEGIFKSRTSHTLDKPNTGDGPVNTSNLNVPPGYKVVANQAGPETKPTAARIAELGQHLVAAGMAPADAFTNPK